VTSPNVELVRSIYSAWERGDFSAAEWADPEIEFVRVDGPDAGSRKGRAGMAEAHRAWLSTWEEWRVKAEDYLALDSERVLVLYDFSGRGKTSGIEVGQLRTTGAQVFHVRDGKVTRLVTYLDRERALTDLGLKE
jgi:ketosteroid isomerase-like protein